MNSLITYIEGSEVQEEPEELKTDRPMISKYL